MAHQSILNTANRKVIDMSKISRIASLVAGLSLVITGVAYADFTTDVATVGWATQNGGTTGGSKATAANTFTVTKASELKDAITKITASGQPGMIKVAAFINWAGDSPTAFYTAANQAANIYLKLPSNTTLVGTTPNAGIKNANILIGDTTYKGTTVPTTYPVKNVIVRNLFIIAPIDLNTTFDPTDGADGNWNSNYDAISIITGANVWIDHVTISDTDQNGNSDGTNRETATYGSDGLFGSKVGSNGKLRQWQRHDGAIDMKRFADYVTISNSIIKNHDKVSLIGHSDSFNDSPALKATYVGNWLDNVVQRLPRVRWGKIHSYNNLFTGSTSGDYGYLVAFGVSKGAQILSENNVFSIPGASNCPAVNQGSAKFGDTGSIVNGAALSCSSFSGAGWTPTYPKGTVLTTANVTTSVKANAGAGKLK